MRDPKPHFSLEDWDFDPNHKYIIKDTHFVSPPTSLASPHTIENQWRCFYLKQTLAADIPGGRLVTQKLNLPAGTWPHRFFFRVQAVAWPLPVNCYFLHPYQAAVRLYRRVASVDTEIKYADLSQSLNLSQWYPMRVTFYSYVDVELLRLFRVIFEINHGAGYVEELVHDDSQNLWEDSGANRVGFGTWCSGAELTQFWDDTEVWEQL